MRGGSFGPLVEKKKLHGPTASFRGGIEPAEPLDGHEADHSHPRKAFKIYPLYNGLKKKKIRPMHVGMKVKILSLRKSFILWSFLGYLETKNRVNGVARMVPCPGARKGPWTGCPTGG